MSGTLTLGDNLNNYLDQKYSSFNNISPPPQRTENPLQSDRQHYPPPPQNNYYQERNRDSTDQSRYYNQSRDRDQPSRKRSRSRDRNRERGGERDRGERDRGDRRDRGGGGGGGDRDRDRGGRRRRDERGYEESTEKRPRSDAPIAPNDSSRGSSRRTEREPERSVSPVHLRKRKLNNWDLPPPGYEGMTVAEVKATGHFPLPGQPARTGALAALSFPYLHHNRLSENGESLATSGTNNPILARQSRRLYVGGIPPNCDELHLMEFFNNAMMNLSSSTSNTPDGKPAIGVQINESKNYAFVEFKTNEEATVAMAFDGISYQGLTLKIRRPKDYLAPTAESAVFLPGVISTNVLDSPYKIFIGGLPPALTEEQVMELLKAFGELRAFNLVKDMATGLSKGFAFAEFLDPTITDDVCDGLNGLELADKKLIVQRASIGATKALEMGENGEMAMVEYVMLPPQLFLGAIPPEEATNVLVLLNITSPEEIEDDVEYKDIVSDVRNECSKYGSVLDVVVPRTPVDADPMTFVGVKGYVRYQTAEEASVAMKAISGMRFDDKTVVVAYYIEEDFINARFV